MAVTKLVVHNDDGTTNELDIPQALVAPDGTSQAISFEDIVTFLDALPDIVRKFEPVIKLLSGLFKRS